MSKIEFLRQYGTVTGIKINDQNFHLTDFLLNATPAIRPGATSLLEQHEPNILKISADQRGKSAVFSLAGDLQCNGSRHYTPLSTTHVNQALNFIASMVEGKEIPNAELANNIRKVGKVIHNDNMVGFGRATCLMFTTLIADIVEGKIHTQQEWRQRGFEIIVTEIQDDKIADYDNQVKANNELLAQEAKIPLLLEKLRAEEEATPINKQEQPSGGFMHFIETFVNLDFINWIWDYKENEPAIKYEPTQLPKPHGFTHGYSPEMIEVFGKVRENMDTFLEGGLIAVYRKEPDLLPPIILNSLAREVAVKVTGKLEVQVLDTKMDNVEVSSILQYLSHQPSI